MKQHPEGQESTDLKKVILRLSPEHQHVIEVLVGVLAKIEGIEVLEQKGNERKGQTFKK